MNNVVAAIITFTMRVFYEEAHCSRDDLTSTTSGHGWVNLKEGGREGA
jgi:hypothetical protein